jgi:hypothetical protein
MNIGDQWNELHHLLTPIKSKGLFGVKGNHGNRVFKETGLQFDETLMTALGLPYLGTAAFWHLKIKESVFSIYTHHGVDSGVSVSSKIGAHQKLDRVVSADVIMSAHSHIALEMPPVHTAYLDTRADNPINWRTQQGWICGCAYDSRSGYAEEKAYPPIISAHCAIHFRGSTNGTIREVSGEIIRAQP